MSATPNNPDDSPQRGRRPKLTRVVLQKFKNLILSGSYRGTAAKSVGIGGSTFRRWMQTGRQYPDGIYGQFRAMVLEAEGWAEAAAVAAVVGAGHGDADTPGDVRHLEWWLERKFPERWGRFRGKLVELEKRLAVLEGAVSGGAVESHEAD